MSREGATADRRTPVAAAATTLARTRRALGAAFRDRVAVAVLGSTAAGYVLVYAAAAGDLGRSGSVRDAAGGLSATTAPSPLASALSGEAVALVAVGLLELLIVPARLAPAVALGALVGANLALSTLAWRRPAACAVSPASGVAAGLPALLSGTACCGPLVFVALGLQATSAALTAIAWLRPAAAILLVASLGWAGWRLDVQASPSSGKMLSGT